jgi:stage II sporulation protein D
VTTGRRAPGRGPERAPVRLARVLLAAVLAAGLARPALSEERIRVRIASEGDRVQDLRLEDYVAGVVSGELPASFPDEAQKAQAVAARSYALTRKLESQRQNRDWDIGTGVLAQVYHPRERPSARAAAAATEGEVLVMGMEPVEAYFHSVCGGQTESGAAALGRELPYLVSVPCGRCDRAPGARWKVHITAAELGRAAGLPRAAESVRIIGRTATGRAERLELSGGGRSASLTGADLRQRLGYGRLPSLAFEVEAARGAFVFTGRGQGHGAGLCQWGAAAMAREGKTYREILAHYYPGTEVVKMY